jgi:hypothetical protein
MVNKTTVRLTIVRKKNKEGELSYRSPRIYLPTKLTDDSSFPFREGQSLIARVLGDKLVVEKIPRPKRKRHVKMPFTNAYSQ